MSALIATTATAAAVGVVILRTASPAPAPRAWMLSAAASAAFAGLTASAMLRHGPLGLWDAIVRDLWATQVWVDLVLAVAVAWVLALPRMRAAGMAVWVWLALTLTTGSVGLLAALARLTFIEARSGAVIGAQSREGSAG